MTSLYVVVSVDVRVDGGLRVAHLSHGPRSHEFVESRSLGQFIVLWSHVIPSRFKFTPDKSDYPAESVPRRHLTFRFSGGPRSGRSAATGC